MAFTAPIPGMSLTKGVGDSPWQQPPLYNTPEEALAFYFKKLDDEDTIDEMLFTLEQGFPLELFVDSMTSAGVMNGFHTVDVKMLISPVLHEHIRLLCETVGIKIVEEAGPSKDEKKATREKAKVKLLLTKALQDPVDPSKAEIAEAKAELSETTPETPEEDATEAPAMPLIKRRGM